MHHILQKKTLPKLKVPTPKPKTRAFPKTEPVPAAPKIEYDVSPLFETIHLLVTAARKKFPGLQEFCGPENFILWCDNWPHHQVIITSACLTNKAYKQWLNEEHYITIKRYTKINKNDWKITQSFIMTESGYPFSYKEYNKQSGEYDSLPTGSIKTGGQGVIIHRENIEIVHELAEQFNTYLQQNKYVERAKFSGPTIDAWQEEQYARRNQRPYG